MSLAGGGGRQPERVMGGGVFFVTGAVGVRMSFVVRGSAAQNYTIHSIREEGPVMSHVYRVRGSAAAQRYRYNYK